MTNSLGVCVDCIRNETNLATPYIEKAHERVRIRYGLPPRIPKTSNGTACKLCSNECVIGEGEKGYCGLRTTIKGQLRDLAQTGRALLHSYRDPHVTNCCAAWFCPAGTGCGHPKFALKDGPEYGYSNLAVFFYGCNFDCLFCQNSSHKEFSEVSDIKKEEFADKIRNDRRLTCLCFFGGSPEPQLPFALAVSQDVIEADPGRVLRVCFEWNGCGNRALVREAAELANRTGGNLKFDMKCFDENLSRALCGVSNRRAFENFEMVAMEFFDRRPNVPNLTATTLLVPGYVDVREVESIAEFIGSINPEIPYSLLLFHPDFEMLDLPVTPKQQVEVCYSAAKKHLRRVNVGNLSLLGVTI